LAISKERKKQIVLEYKELLNENPALILTSYSGLSVKELENLRHQIREVGGKFHIVKNNLIEKAFKEVDYPLPEGVLVGPTAIGFASEDIIGVAKAIVEISKTTEVMSIKGAVIDGAIYDAGQVRRMAELPPMPVVQAQFLSLLQTPATRAVGIFASSVRQVVSVLKSYSESEPATV
jgi:large subunit ribosomal protein L10